MYRRILVELVLVVSVAIILLWVIPCYTFCSAETTYVLSVRIFGLILIALWIVRTARLAKEQQG
ncbi:MAG: hypothetical protein ACOC5L_03435 [Halobacteriota archaeon]